MKMSIEGSNSSNINVNSVASTSNQAQTAKTVKFADNVDVKEYSPNETLNLTLPSPIMREAIGDSILKPSRFGPVLNKEQGIENIPESRHLMAYGYDSDSSFSDDDSVY